MFIVFIFSFYLFLFVFLLFDFTYLLVALQLPCSLPDHQIDGLHKKVVEG